MFPTVTRAARWLYGQPYVLLVMPPLFWGLNITLGRHVVGHIPPVALSQIRWTLAFVLLLPFAAGRFVRDWPAIRRQMPLIVVLSLTGISIYNTFVYVGLHSTTAINAALLQSFQPVMIAVYTLLIYGDRLTAYQAIGIAVSLAGVVAIVTQGEPSVLFAFAINGGDLWVLAAILAYALYTALLKSRPKVHPLSLILVLLALGQLFLVPATVWEWATGARTHFDLLTVLAGLYVAVFASILAYFCYNRGVELIGPNRAGPFLHLVPLFGSLFAIVLLGETPYWYHATGWMLIVAGITIAQQRRRRAV